MSFDEIDRRLPILFLVVGSVLGALYAFAMPPMQVADEMMHFARAYSISTGACIASPDIDMPKSFVLLNDEFPRWLERSRKIAPGEIQAALRLPLQDRDWAGGGFERSLDGFINQNLYHCAPYLPEAIMMSLGRHLSATPLALMYLCRLTNLACYLALTYLALRLLPDFKILLTCLALMPMALHQAASVSIDATINGASFLFAAYVFRLAFGKPPLKLGPVPYAILAALIVFLVLGKTMLCVVVLPALIPAARFGSRRIKWAAIAAFVILGIGCAAIWQRVNDPNIERLAQQRINQGVDVQANIEFLKEKPVDFARIALRGALDRSYVYFNLREFVGTLGWASIPLPRWLVLTYTLLLMLAAATQTRTVKVPFAARAMLAVFAIAAVLNLMAGAWVLEALKGIMDRPELWSRMRIPMQGRYWIAVAFPMLLILSNRRIVLAPRVFAVAAASVMLVANAIALMSVGRTYYF